MVACKRVTPFQARAWRSNRSTARVVAHCSTSQSDRLQHDMEVVTARRSMLWAAAVTVVGAALPAGAQSTKCSYAEDDDSGRDCRLSNIEVGTKVKDYGQAQSLQAVQGVPVADMSDEYVRETVRLIAVIEDYLTLDVYDKKRQEAIKVIKNDGSAWVSKYARGGSARKQSARTFYIVIDSIRGHLTSNGLAPLPSSKAKKLRVELDAAKEYLAESR